MAANETTPKIPRKPEMKTVNKLIGICNPNSPPNTLKKNKKSTPIPNFIKLWPTNFVGFGGAPIKNNTIINTTITVITMVEDK